MPASDFNVETGQFMQNNRVEDWKEIAAVFHHQFEMMCNLLDRQGMTIEKMKRHAGICRQGIQEALQNPEQRKSRCVALAAIAMATKGNAP